MVEYFNFGPTDLYSTSVPLGASQSAASFELMNQYIMDTNPCTGIDPGSLHIGTVITQFPAT